MWYAIVLNAIMATLNLIAAILMNAPLNYFMGGLAAGTFIMLITDEASRMIWRKKGLVK